MSRLYRYVQAVPRRAATGQVSAVYAQIARDFLLTDGPLMSLSPAPEILTATWALLREAQIAGRAERSDMEVIATAVSKANDCAYCVDAHTALIHATGKHHLAEDLWHGRVPDDPREARLVTWAMATGTPDAASTPKPYADELSPEYVGTALATHFINRMTSSLLNEHLLPGNLQRLGAVRRVAGRALTESVRRQLIAGEGLDLLAPRTPQSTPAWALGSPVGTAYAALATATGASATVLGGAASELVLGYVDQWTGRRPALLDDWPHAALDALPDVDRPGAEIALMAAVDPHLISDRDVAVFRAVHDDDAALIRVIAFGAMAAVRRIEGWLTKAQALVREPVPA